MAQRCLSGTLYPVEIFSGNEGQLDIFLPASQPHSFPAFSFEQTRASLFLLGERAPRWNALHRFSAPGVRHFH